MVEIKDIQAVDLDAEVKSSTRPVVLEFWIRSCDQCRKFKPIYEKLLEHFDNVRFYRMNMMMGRERTTEAWEESATPRSTSVTGTIRLAKGRETGWRAKMLPPNPCRRIIPNLTSRSGADKG